LTTRERDYWKRTTSVGVLHGRGRNRVRWVGLLFVLQMMVGDILS
jgi:hypothetical protein